MPQPVYPGATPACAQCVCVMGVMVSMHTKLVTLIPLRDLLIKAKFISPTSVALLPGYRRWEGGSPLYLIHDVGGQTRVVPSNRVEQ